MRNYAILGLILLLGFLVRAYNLNFPSIGYHNMKENEYLSMAQEMQRTQDFVTRRIYFYNAFDDNPLMKLYPQPPLISYQILLSWKLLGENLWGARLFNVFFGVGSIALIFFLARLLFAEEALALFSALLLAIMPLAVFFSRNLQPESPAFFWMLAGTFFYMRFALSGRLRNLIPGGLCFCVAWLYKFSFLVGVLPFVVCMPYRRIFSGWRQALKSACVFILPYLVIAGSVFLLKRIGQWEFERAETFNRIMLLAVFTPDYWAHYGKMIWWYVRGENFTLVFTVLAALGILFAFLRRKGPLDRYIMGGVFALAAYSMVFADHINQHNYYQMPFLPLVCLSAALFLSFASGSLTGIIKRNITVYLAAGIVLVAAIPAYQSISRMHSTVFLGQDVAGESLKEFTAPHERAFLFTYAQGYAIARYARRYMGPVKDLEEFERFEKKFDIRYICFYPAEYAHMLKDSNPPLYEYIRSHYHVKEVGMAEEPNKIFYVILERGEGSDAETFLKSFSGSMQVRAIYNILGRLVFFYSLRVAPPSADIPHG